MLGTLIIFLLIITSMFMPTDCIYISLVRNYVLFCINKNPEHLGTMNRAALDMVARAACRTAIAASVARDVPICSSGKLHFICIPGNFNLASTGSA